MREPVTPPGFSNYRIFDTGVVESKKSGKWKPLKGTPYKPGNHIYVKLIRDDGVMVRFQVHRLVIENFVGPCPPGKECRHLNGDPSDNRVENLAWGTRLQNMMDKKLHGTLYVARGEDHRSSKLTSEDVLKMRQMYDLGFNCKQISIRFNVSHATACAAVTGRSWKHLPGERGPIRSARSRVVSEQERLNIVLLRALGFSCRQIGSWFGLHRGTIEGMTA